MKHLPEGCQVSGKWSRKIIPTLIHCIRNQNEVWTLKDDLLCATLQSIWDVVYKGSITHMVTPNGPVIAVALEQLSEWRNGLSSITLVVLANFLSSQKDLKTDENHKNILTKLLHKLAFLFEDIRDDSSKHMRPYESDLITQMLMQHHCATLGAVHVQRTTTLTYGKGALCLATALACLSTLSLHIADSFLMFQMKCALTLFAEDDIVFANIEINSKGKASKTPQRYNKSTGKESSTLLAFSEAN
ncbi:hypothetical protein EV424DRAFT_1546761 [Suillus variegatus]|nr:hypothetical protein EV424DRAFT_1546761 [Suillus variegatus]